ncbi:MAG TPA: tetratricopeptide repeat protein [Chitinivibrionales bacterium]|nr:tetratricopeptide repeat protein [Chitinivibrionales bacterium]
MEYHSFLKSYDDSAADLAIEEPEGRLLSDGEYAQALTDRNDVFAIAGGHRLAAIETAALAAGVLFGLWLHAQRPRTAAPDFLSSTQKEWTARLLRSREMRSPSLAVVQEVPAGETAATITLLAPSWDREALKRGIHLPEAAAKRNAAREQKSSLSRELKSVKVAANGSAVGQDTALAGGEISKLIDRGNAVKKYGNRAEAFAAFRRVLTHDPYNTAALSGLGDLFLYTGLLDSSAAFYKAAIAVDPRNAVAHNGLGSALYYNSTMATNPNFARLRHIADPDKFSRAQYDSAIAEYTAAISLDSSQVTALTNRGVLKDIGNDREGAIADYSLAIRINPKCADAYTKRAATLKSLRKYEEAIADYTAAIKLDTSSYGFDPKTHFVNAYFGRGTTYYRSGDLDRAIRDFDTALALSPDHSLVIINRAIALIDEKKYDGAIAGLTRAIALLSPLEYNGLRYLAYLQRGNAYKALGQYDKAIADYTAALASKNLAARACWRIAECFSLKKEADSAFAWLRKSSAAGFTDFSAWKRDRELSALRSTREFKEIAGQ